MARAQKYSVESQMLPQELEIDKLKAVTTNIRDGENDDKEFERRLKIADMLLKEKQVSLQEQSMSAKKVENESSKAMEQQLMQRLMPRES